MGFLVLNCRIPQLEVDFIGTLERSDVTSKMANDINHGLILLIPILREKILEGEKPIFKIFPAYIQCQAS
jgi:hypothetical protein